MKYCPKCGNKYPNDITFCTVDGSALGDRSEAETLRMKREDDPLKALRIMGDLTTVIPARVEYIVQKVWVDEGASFEFKANTNIARIHVKEIVEEMFSSGVYWKDKKKEYGAKIQVSPDMGPMCGGTETINVSLTNFPEFIVPVKTTGEEKRSIFSFYAQESISLLFRILVEQINTHHRRVELNIAYLWFSK